MFRLGEVPHRWKHPRRFAPQESYRDPNTISTCYGTRHNASGHFATLYLCQDYWTIQDPLNPAPAHQGNLQDRLRKALTLSFNARGLPPSSLSRYKRVERIVVQEDDPLEPWFCGTFAMSTILHFLLGDKHPHEIRPGHIIRNHMLSFHIALLEWLLAGAPPPLWTGGCLTNTIPPIDTTELWIHSSRNIASVATLPKGRLWHPSRATPPAPPTTGSTHTFH